MGEFKRSHSKVWWASEGMEWRAASSSPGSQDSGFSDTETCSHSQGDTKINQPTCSKQQDLFKNADLNLNALNLTGNYKEKLTPHKNPPPELIKKSYSEPIKKNRYIKHSSKVSRNLFDHRPRTDDKIENTYDDQYAEDDGRQEREKQIANTNNITSNTSTNSFNADLSIDLTFDNTVSTQDSLVSSNSFPFYKPKGEDRGKINSSAPGYLEWDDGEEVTCFNESESESELEQLFNGKEDMPKHTSTPKSANKGRKEETLSEKIFPRFRNERVPPIHVENEIDNEAVQTWLKEARDQTELEYMTTLQTKSIASELTQKVSAIAASMTETIRKVLTHARCIESDYQTLTKDEENGSLPAHNLSLNVLEFIATFRKESYPKFSKIFKKMKISEATNLIKLSTELYTEWISVKNIIYMDFSRNLVATLEDPRSEIELRASTTALTSICLRNEEMIHILLKCEVVPTLLVLCEKCEGSTLRSLILRALSTLCCVSTSVRQFEKFSGMQIIADTLEEFSRPEPERSEALTLLAQVTAPWIEDNNNVRGLPEFSKSLVKSITKFISSTKCCQNLLLCTAALANITTMDPNCVRYILHQNTIKELMSAVKRQGNRATVYLLEQLATFIANITAVESARNNLIENYVPATLLSFLSTSYVGEDVERRLQQKSIIALSRLCSNQQAAMQVVEIGGINKLVKLCREKKARFNSDAVLVASLATLRKISESCGNKVFNVQDSQELVEPKLLDSFLAYSAQNESYV